MVYVKIRFHDNDDSCENDGHLDLQGDIKLCTKRNSSEMKAQMELKAYEHDMTRIHMHESHALRAHIAMKLTT